MGTLNGEIKNFTGIDSPYERPLSPYYFISKFNNRLFKK
ncbi:adenylyl-sulfate kinase [Lebetimonas sp. JS138]